MNLASYTFTQVITGQWVKLKILNTLALSLWSYSVVDGPISMDQAWYFGRTIPAFATLPDYFLISVTQQVLDVMIYRKHIFKRWITVLLKKKWILIKVLIGKECFLLI